LDGLGTARTLAGCGARSVLHRASRTIGFDRMDDNDNRLFGVTAEILWVPKPAYQLTLRTPLYFVGK
jgi:hypothetical protein